MSTATLTTPSTAVRTCTASIGCDRPAASAQAEFCTRHLVAYADGARDLAVWEERLAGHGRRRLTMHGSML